MCVQDSCAQPPLPDPGLPEMGIPPSPVLWCPVKSKNLLCEVETAGLTVWFKCMKVLFEEVGPTQDTQDAEEEADDDEDAADERWVGKLKEP